MSKAFVSDWEGVDNDEISRDLNLAAETGAQFCKVGAIMKLNKRWIFNKARFDE